MFKELENLVYNDVEQMKNINEKTATIGVRGIRITARVEEGKNLEEILGEKEMIR